MKAEWANKTLGEVCGFVRGPFGGSLKKSIFVSDGFAVYEQQHAIYDQFDDIRYFIDAAKFIEMSRFELRPNDLIMSCSGTLGKVAIVPPAIQRGIINQALLKLTPSATLMPHFLKYWMVSPGFQDSLKEQSGGAAIQNVASVGTLKQIKFACPPLPEQHRIVTILDEAFDGIATAKANAEKNLHNARAIFESHLQSVFTQRGALWTEAKLDDVCGFQNGFAFKSDTFKPSGVPIIRISNIQDGRIDINNRLVFCDPKDYSENLERYRIIEGDLLIAMSGATTGKLGFNTESTVFYLNQRVGKFEPRPNLNKRFLYHFLSTKIEENLRISAGAAQPNLSTEQIKRFDIPLPPIDEQAHIVDAIETLFEETQRLESVYQEKLTALDELKKSLLHSAFNGEL